MGYGYVQYGVVFHRVIVISQSINNCSYLEILCVGTINPFGSGPSCLLSEVVRK